MSLVQCLLDLRTECGSSTAVEHAKVGVVGGLFCDCRLSGSHWRPGGDRVRHDATASRRAPNGGRVPSVRGPVSAGRHRNAVGAGPLVGPGSSRMVAAVGWATVPRWLLLGPAFAIGSLMTVYFTVTMVKITEDTIGGAWHQSFGTLPLAFFSGLCAGIHRLGSWFGRRLIWVQSGDPIACRACGRQ